MTNAGRSLEVHQHDDPYPGPTHEYGDLPEAPARIKNVGWTLGNDCPYRCTHCYSMSARRKGRNMSRAVADRIVAQLASLGVETVNLGGNEPLFTNGLDPRQTLLPYIIEQIAAAGIGVGLTTSGITLLHLYREHRSAFDLLNDVDISLDSPFEAEHDANRGARLYALAMQSLEICQRHDLASTIIMAGMNWNFTPGHIAQLVKIAACYNANVRINPIKPTEPRHMELVLPASSYFLGFSQLLQLCQPVDLGEPPLAALTRYREAGRCPCGRASFRIHSITPEGQIFVSPCVYLHDYRAPLDLLQYPLSEIVHSPQFRVFRQRNANPEQVRGCQGCPLVSMCGGGCAARAYLHHLHETGQRTMLARDPYCPLAAPPDLAFPQQPRLANERKLVHMDYLCTWIGRPFD